MRLPSSRKTAENEQVWRLGRYVKLTRKEKVLFGERLKVHRELQTMGPDLRFWGKGVWEWGTLENDEGNYVIRGNPEVSAGMRGRGVCSWATFPEFLKVSWLSEQGRGRIRREDVLQDSQVPSQHGMKNLGTPEICSLTMLKMRHSESWGKGRRAATELAGVTDGPRITKEILEWIVEMPPQAFCFNSLRSTCLLIRILSMTSCTNIWGKALWFSHLKECFARKWSCKEDGFRIMCFLKQKAQTRVFKVHQVKMEDPTLAQESWDRLGAGMGMFQDDVKSGLSSGSGWSKSMDLAS